MEEWCRVKLLLLHHHSEPKELRKEDKSWQHACDRCPEDHEEDGHRDNLLTKPQRAKGKAVENSDSDFADEEEVADENRSQNDWMRYAGLDPGDDIEWS